MNGCLKSNAVHLYLLFLNRDKCLEERLRTARFNVVLSLPFKWVLLKMLQFLSMKLMFKQLNVMENLQLYKVLRQLLEHAVVQTVRV